MALQVWLPLNKNGDLKNQGLADVTVTNNGATYNSSGKIGGCYTGFNTGFMSLNKEAMSTLSGEFTISCWVKINSYNSNYQTVWSGCSTSSSWNNMIMVLLRNGNGSNLIFCISNNSSATQSSCSAGAIELGNWMHITCCYKPGHIITYKNGILVQDYATSITPNVSTIKSCQIGRDYGAYPNDMNINDFRIYNHCLSEDEIHELSLGKVGHWKLNDREISRSGLTSVTWNQLVKNGNFANGYTDWTTPNNATITIDSNKVVTITKTNGSGIGALFASNVTSVNTSHKYYISAQLANGTVSAAFGFHASGGSVSSNTVLYSDSTTLKKYSAVVQPIRTTDILFVRCGASATANGNTCKCANIICIDLTQMFGSGNEPTVEQFKEMFPLHYYPFDSGTTKDLRLPIPDISGNHYNLTVSGDPTLNDNSVRYDKSTLFNGSNYLSCTSPTAEAKTLSLWAYVGSALPSANQVLFADSKSKLAIGFHPSQHGMLCKCTDTSKSEFSDSLVQLNSWNHFCLVNGDTKQLYINGNIANKISYSSTWTHQSDVLMIGNRSYNNGTGYQNKISDVRLYATALSADDVQKLYKLGNI